MKSVSELAISALQEALHAEAIELRLASAEALVQFTTGGQDEVVAVLAEIASGQSDNLRSKAIRSIGRLGPPAKHAVPALKRALEADSAGLRADAAHSLWLVDRDPAAVVAMAKLLSVPVEYQYAYNVPSTVAGRLGHIGPEAVGDIFKWPLWRHRTGPVSLRPKAARKIIRRLRALAGLHCGKKMNQRAL